MPLMVTYSLAVKETSCCGNNMSVGKTFAIAALLLTWQLQTSCQVAFSDD